jgi:hypothetical protein
MEWRWVAALLGCEDGVSTLDGGIIGGQTSDVNSIGQRVAVVIHAIPARNHATICLNDS